jgi:hypothetical protein
MNIAELAGVRVGLDEYRIESTMVFAFKPTWKTWLPMPGDAQ